MRALRFAFLLPVYLLPVFSIFVASHGHAQDSGALGDALLFHASFDTSADADFAKGDGKIYTAQSLKREKVTAGLNSDGVGLDKQNGRFGGALAFTKKSDKIIFFRGADNLPATKAGFQGTFCFWLRLTPDDDLPPGYVDPLQITDKKWNDSSFFVDFTKDKPRTFRLGAFSDIAFWNPSNRKWDDVPVDQRPLVTVKQPPFARDKWTHVAITFRDFNHEGRKGTATLYLNGAPRGSINKQQRVTWSDQRLAIMLGIYYVGHLDDFAVFNRALDKTEVDRVYKLPAGIGAIRSPSATKKR